MSLNKLILETEIHKTHNGNICEISTPEGFSPLNGGDADHMLEFDEKDRQLELAAEYGKSLLQKNEELELQIECLNKDFKQKLEDSWQERHVLKLQIATTKLEHDAVLSELRNDLSDLQRQLEEERKQSRLQERANQERIQELMACNENLTDQMLNASLLEEEHRLQVNNLQLHVSETELEQGDHFNALQDEISELRLEMENRIKLKTEECRLLSASLDEAQELVASLKKEKEEEMKKARHFEEEFLRLEDINMQLLSKLENISMSATSGALPLENETSLFAELEILSHSMSVDSFDNRPAQKVTIGTQLKQEILEVYRQMQRLSLEVKGFGDQWSPEAVDINDLKAGQLLLTLTDLRTLICQRLETNSSPITPGDQVCISNLQSQVASLKDQVNNLKEQLSNTKSTLQSVKCELGQRDQQLQRSLEEIIESKHMVVSLQQQLSKLQREKDCLQDQSVGLLTKDEVLQQNRQDRDDAIECKNQLQMQLSKSKLDLKSLERQLMESVQQKLQLSKQLEEWQSDMHDLIEDKMAGEIARDKMKGHKTPATSITNNSATKKRFSLKWS